MKSLLMLLLCCGAIGFLVSCGDDPSLAKQLSEWAGSAEATEVGLRDATEFRPRLPPLNESELNSVSHPGVFDGVQAELAMDGMSRGTNLEREESENLTCYLMTEAARGELSLDPAALEEEIVGYIEDRFVEQVPQAQFRASVESFAEAVAEAESAGEAAFNSALATVCG